MKLRRALAAAAVTAVVAPAALLAAPSAHATGDTSASPSASASASPDETDVTDVTDETASETATDPAPGDATGSPAGSPGATEETDGEETGEAGSGEEETPAPDASESTTSAPANPSPSASAPEGSEGPEESQAPDPEPSVCEDSKVDVAIEGLPGEIAAGSGWHEFSLNVANDSGSTLRNLEYLAGASADLDGEELFESEKVGLQAWNPEDESWVDLDELGYAVGYIGYTDELAPDYEVAIPMRINVRADAPVGAGFTLGATIYGDADGECTGFGDVAYKFRIVAPGTDTEGTRPQEGGKAPLAPVTVEKAPANVPEVTGSLASTGAGSALPVIGLVGGLAVVVGGGAVFVVRRRKAGSDT
ncbi:LPXTG cell wall anchor domain-containing protein [Streptomyces sp. G3]|uniref:LPXTG cell wall anchor domain-containing protein n=1 Tax=unclassified Streptomyces TaxID=2593676 RepID=UPI0015E156D7|nr:MULTISPECIES: LPXTG cell wall anchor domain-containing protein [unclassified Streptomyces]MCM1937924.1 LPXTG cell wall anchor domain-containing protein [Streptomyces sp. G3]WKX19173.1 LPXTG cell wall anchor domain-containing protein [Streptomyces sp. HUAS CX7]